MANPALRLISPTLENGTVRPPRRKLNADLRPREYLTAAEVERLRKAAGDDRYCHRDSTMILIAYRHGLRASELCALRWDNVDLAGGKMHVNRAKNGSPSVHPLSGVELRALRRLQGESPAGPFVFVSEHGSPFTTAGFRKMLARLGAAANSGSASTRICCATPAATSWPTMATILDHCNTTLATRTSRTPCGTPSWRPIGSRAFGRIDGGSTGQPRRLRRKRSFQPGRAERWQSRPFGG